MALHLVGETIDKTRSHYRAETGKLIQLMRGIYALDSIQAAMSDFGGEMPDTLARSIVNAPGATSWPIAGYTYLLVYLDQTDCAKGGKIVKFINWALGPDGSTYAKSLQYVPLPDAVRQQVVAKLKTITCNGAPLPS
jgi:phosphate transport system substrate-binding protein